MAQMQSFFKKNVDHAVPKIVQLVSFKICIFYVAFVYEKPNSKGICKGMLFPLLF